MGTEFPPTGFVTLVGAGPGDPGLLTLAGRDALATAEVVLYDRLACEELLDWTPPDCLRIPVGKTPGSHPVPQKEIQEMLVFYARQGKRVVRLKGGDPFVFGRGGEEYSHLQKNHIPCRVIPGISSAIAAPASAGIPVTDRRHAASFRVISGNAFTEETAGNLAWEDLARGSDTLVVLMGMATLPLLTRKLMAHGRAPETPAALIQEGTTPRQRQARATLGTLAEVAVREALSNPAVIVIGEVAALGR